MSATIIDNIKGSDLPASWADKIKALPDERYTVTIRRQKEHQSLEKIMSEISRRAKDRGMTPQVLEDILGEKITHIL